MFHSFRYNAVARAVSMRNTPSNNDKMDEPVLRVRWVSPSTEV